MVCATGGVCDGWCVRLVVCVTGGVCDGWCVRLVVFATGGVCPLPVCIHVHAYRMPHNTAVVQRWLCTVEVIVCI